MVLLPGFQCPVPFAWISPLTISPLPIPCQLRFWGPEKLYVPFQKIKLRQHLNFIRQLTVGQLSLTSENLMKATGLLPRKHLGKIWSKFSRRLKYSCSPNLSSRWKGKITSLGSRRLVFPPQPAVGPHQRGLSSLDLIIPYKPSKMQYVPPRWARVSPPLITHEHWNAPIPRAVRGAAGSARRLTSPLSLTLHQQQCPALERTRAEPQARAESWACAEDAARPPPRPEFSGQRLPGTHASLSSVPRVPCPHLYSRDRRGQLLRGQVPKLLRKHVHAVHDKGRRKQNPHAPLRCARQTAVPVKSGARWPK